MSYLHMRDPDQLLFHLGADRFEAEFLLHVQACATTNRSGVQGAR